MKLANGYYLVKDRLAADELVDHDIAAYDVETNTWTFCGDAEPYPHNGRWQVMKYLCDPECSELRLKG